MSLEKDELKFENELYNYLAHVGGSKQWQKMDNIHTTDDLWDNFRKIIYQLNQDKLLKPLSDAEFNQVKKQILNQSKTPYDAGVFLYGVGGKSQVEIDRDDSKHVYLTIFDQDQIGAGDTVYQVVKQIERNNVIKGKRHRRFDTTLLINGLPIIQIEEKVDGHSAKEALNQMHQYAFEDQYSGIFSMVQILVAMTPHDVRYMANTTSDDFNTDFAFQWKENKENAKPIYDWRQFADKFLSIPMAHKMATNYMILDNTKNHQSIKVMRYYQVYATKRIIDELSHHDFAPNNKKVGYIWHTTGSGKTISSFKTAFLASRLPNVDKVVFLVDRVALTNQTASEYKAYDPNSDQDNNGGVVSDTKNVYDLKKKLKSKKQNSIVVTSTQKMDHLVSDNHFKMDDKNIVFIVDEAHRSTGGDMLKRIRDAFAHSAWIGYTGTPNFNPKYGPTTEQIFGNPLHRYVISDAISDHNVLGFQVDFRTTLPQDELKNKYLPQYFKRLHPEWNYPQIEHRINSLTDSDMDDNVQSSVYDNQPDHVRQVVQDILKYWKNRSADYRYNAMLTTHVGGQNPSIPMAIMYYDEFKRQTKKMDNPIKVAVTFSQDNSNSDNQLNTNKNLSRIIQEYNQEFNTNFDDTTVDEYMEDVVSRLKQTASDGNYLDLVIVVDQLLTGFDAPKMNTLYVDRTLRGSNLIQAYSRTNRIENMQHKPYGHIVNYRWPAKSEQWMKKALEVYANPASANVQTEFEFPKGVLAESYDKVKDRLKDSVSDLSKLTDDFTSVPKSENQQEQTYDELSNYNHLLSKVKQYDEFKDEGTEGLFNDIGLDEDSEGRLTGGIADDLKQNVAKKHDVDPIDLKLKMEHVKDVTVNYDYLHELIAEYINKSNEESSDSNIEELKKLKNSIEKALNSLGNNDQKYASQVRDLINDNLSDEVKSTLKPEEVDDLIKSHGENYLFIQTKTFMKIWGLVDEDIRKKIMNLIDQHQLGKDDLNQSSELNQIVTKGQSSDYKTNSNDEEVRNYSKIKYHKNFVKAFRKFADKIKKHI